MLIDPAALLGSRDTYDVIIVGAGPAGISIVLRLLGSGIRVLLVEAGGFAERRDARDDKGGIVVPGTGHPPLDLYRVRALGGTSRIWGGRVVPYDRIDFAQRDWVQASGWPIPYQAVARYYADAFKLAEAGHGQTDAASALPGRPAELIEGLDDANIVTTLEWFSRPTDFWKRYGKRILADPNVHILTNASATKLTGSQARQKVDAVDIDLPSIRVRVSARYVILATGGLEVTRLLLASNSGDEGAIRNVNGLIGRYYMGHYCATLGSISLGPLTKSNCDYERDAMGTYARRRLWFSEEAQSAHRLLNVTFRTHVPEPADPKHGDAVLSAMFLAKTLVQREYAARFAEGPVPLSHYPKHIANILKGTVPLAHFTHLWARNRLLADRKLPSVVRGPIKGEYAIEFHCEQSPCYESRVSLSELRDRHGVPRLKLDWRYNESDVNALAHAYSLLGERLSSSGLGRLHYDLSQLPNKMVRHGLATGHHIGTTRMSATPELGVVDRECRVHGLANLFVASSSVFPTAGQANPTLTIIALALRLADCLKDNLRYDGMVAQQRVSASTPTHAERVT